jgi:hypothetical protein
MVLNSGMEVREIKNEEDIILALLKFKSRTSKYDKS